MIKQNQAKQTSVQNRLDFSNILEEWSLVMLVMEVKTGDDDGWRQNVGKWGENAIFGRYLSVANLNTFLEKLEFVLYNISEELISISI